MYHGWIYGWRRFGWMIVAAAAFHLTAGAPTCLGGEGEKTAVNLYFADARDPVLIAETRLMVDPGDPIAFGRMLVAELISGSAQGNLPTIPPGTRLLAFFLLDDGTAVVDFSKEFRENHPGSCRLEQLTLFSVVNSLALNVPEIERVQILIAGTEAQTLAGHLPLEFPLTADMLLTR